MKRKNLRIKALKRDEFTCQKCFLEDKTMKVLEAHHILPLCFGGKDELDNLIALCLDCHHFAPNNKKDFDEYMEEQCTGTMTILIKSINKVRKEHSELFEEAQKEFSGDKNIIQKQSS